MDPTLLADVSDLTLHRTGAGEIAALGGLRSGGDQEAIDPLSPRHTRVRADRPVFSWNADGEFDLFTVTVLSDDGTVWSGTTTGTEMAYPEDAPVLEPGVTYYWRVEGEALLDTTRSGLVAFEVVAPDEVARLNEAEADLMGRMEEGDARDFLLGSFYAKQGLHAEAITVFERLAERQPDAPLALEILGKLYYETGRKDLAVKSLQKALDVSRK